MMNDAGAPVNTGSYAGACGKVLWKVPADAAQADLSSWIATLHATVGRVVTMQHLNDQFLFSVNRSRASSPRRTVSTSYRSAVVYY